jgi:hypothetical protein
VVVLGILGQTPFAGVAWQVLHYLEGFRRLGYDVYYVEDTGDWPYDPEQGGVTDDCRYTASYIARLMTWCGLPDRWGYRAAAQGGRSFGLAESQLAHLFEEADTLVNVTGSTWLRDEHLRVPIRIYLETDPVLRQIEVAQGRQSTIDHLSAHTHHFTYGENFGAPDCGVPLGRFDYRPTRQPIVLDWWTSAGRLARNGSRQPSAASAFTTISSWQQSGKDVEWNGETYHWSKHLEFLRFIDLPRRTGQPLELALAPGGAQATRLFTEAVQLLRSHGWWVVDAIVVSKDILPYRGFILRSRGEFTVAKDQNVRLRSGWFSDRSACYLAAGKPVITQDTGFGNILPTGRGLFAFRTVDEILDAFGQIDADYDTHAQAAREIAREYFAAERVLASLAERVGL